MISLVVQLDTASKAARDLHVRLASAEEAKRTNAPTDWACVVVDRCDDETAASLRVLVAMFEAGLAAGRRWAA